MTLTFPTPNILNRPLAGQAVNAERATRNLRSKTRRAAAKTAPDTPAGKHWTAALAELRAAEEKLERAADFIRLAEQE